MTDRPKPVVLCILDGWGIRQERENNAVALARTPMFNKIWQNCPKTTLRADGEFVGLPAGQFGNSEVGHLNIGAGRIVMQDLPRISHAFAEQKVMEDKSFLGFIQKMLTSKGDIHLVGLCSDGGVHAHLEHIAAMAQLTNAAKVKTHLHLITDGRDTPPKSAEQYIRHLKAKIDHYPYVSIATVSGRFYAMDRDNRWERVQEAFNAIAHGKGQQSDKATKAISAGYERDETDEFITPTVIGEYTGIKENDGLFMANFRADRAREILQAFVKPDFDGFDRGAFTSIKHALGMVSYSDELDQYLETIFKPIEMSNLLGETISKAGLKQLRIAETEKYPHVTYFFNGGIETPYDGEERILVPSPKVKTYDLQPEMSAPEMTEKLVNAINQETFDFIVVNFANPDMVGHTGDLNAAIKACETVDHCLADILKAVKEKNGTTLVIADHGNADQMVDPDTGIAHTAHTTNPVPCIIVNAPNNADVLKSNGKLGDVAPTILKLMGLDKPEDMTGKALF